MVVSLLTACSPRPAPFAVHADEGGGVTVELPRCEVGAYAVLVYPAGEGPGAAPLTQVPVPAEGGTVTIEPADLGDGDVEIAVGATSVVLDPSTLPDDGGRLVVEGGEGEGAPGSAASWDDLRTDFCDAEGRDTVLVLALLLGAALVPVLAALAGVLLWRRLRPRQPHPAAARR